MLSDFKSLFRQSIIYALAPILTKLMGFVLLPLFNKTFLPQGMGVVALLDATLQIATVVIGFCLYSGFFRFYWDKEVQGHQKSLFYTITVFQIFLAIVIYIIAFFNLTSISNLIFNKSQYGWYLHIVLISALLQVIMYMPSTLMRLQENPRLYVSANAVQLLITLLSTLYFILYLKTGIEGIYYGQIAGCVAYLIAVFSYTLRNMTFTFERKLLVEVIKFCFPIFLSAVAILVLNITDKFFLKSDLSGLGVYNQGYKLANTLNMFIVTSINFAIQPMIYKKMNEPDNTRFYAKLMTYEAYVTMFFGLAMMVFGLEISKLLSGGVVEFYDAWQIMPYIIYAVVFGMMKDMAVTGLNIVKRTKSIMFIVIIIALLNIVFNTLLIPYMGSHGAALAKMISTLLFFVFILIASQKAYYIPYEYSRLAQLLIVAGLLFGVSVFVNTWNPAWRIIIKTFIICIFPFILYVTRFYTPMEVQVIKSGWYKWKNPEMFSENFKNLLKGNKKN